MGTPTGLHLLRTSGLASKRIYRHGYGLTIPGRSPTWTMETTQMSTKNKSLNTQFKCSSQYVIYVCMLTQNSGKTETYDLYVISKIRVDMLSQPIQAHDVPKTGGFLLFRHLLQRECLHFFYHKMAKNRIWRKPTTFRKQGWRGKSVFKREVPRTWREEVFRNERPSLGRGVRVFGAPLGETSNSKKFRERTGSDSLAKHPLGEHPNLRVPS